jgi:hypothetical protein
VRKIVTERQARMVDRGYVWAVYRILATELGESGRVVSLHKTADAAQEAANRRGNVGVVYLGDEFARDDLNVID